MTTRTNFPLYHIVPKDWLSFALRDALNRHYLHWTRHIDYSGFHYYPNNTWNRFPLLLDIPVRHWSVADTRSLIQYWYLKFPREPRYSCLSMFLTYMNIRCPNRRVCFARCNTARRRTMFPGQPEAPRCRWYFPTG